jgi:hypothetical protein
VRSVRFLGTEFLDRESPAAIPGIVDEDIVPGSLIDDLTDSRGDLIGLGHIDLQAFDAV